MPVFSTIAGVATALGGAATLVPAAAVVGTSLLSNQSSSKATKQATQAQTQAADQATAEQRRQFDATMSMLQPRIDAGDTALGQMMFELGLAPQPGVPGVTLPAAQGGPNFGGGPRGNRPGAINGQTGQGGQGPVGGGSFGGGNVMNGEPFGTGPTGSTFNPNTGETGFLGGMGSAGGFGAPVAGGAGFALPNMTSPNNMASIQGGGGPPAGLAAQGGQAYDPKWAGQSVAGPNGGALPVNNGVAVGEPNPGTPVAGQLATGGDPRFDNFHNTPGYEYALQEGRRNLDASAASRGMLLRGSQLQRLQEHGQGLADQNYGNYFARLQSIAGLGQTATGTAAGVGSATAGNISNIVQGAGDARASSYLTQGALGSQNVGNIGGAIGDVLGGVNWGGGSGNAPKKAPMPTPLTGWA